MPNVKEKPTGKSSEGETLRKDKKAPTSDKTTSLKNEKAKALVQKATALVAQHTELPAANSETYQVFYAINPKTKAQKNITTHEFHHSYIKVADVQAIDPKQILWKMQADQWSPHGEGQRIIGGLGLSHISITEGDIIRTPDTKYLMVTADGLMEVFANQKKLA
jgi:hypothetical protein